MRFVGCSAEHFLSWRSDMRMKTFAAAVAGFLVVGLLAAAADSKVEAIKKERKKYQ